MTSSKEHENHWRRIWNKPVIATASHSVLEELLIADGLNSPMGGLSNSAIWLDFAMRMASRLGMQPGDSIFEVGCGSGAFLYPFYEQGYAVAGLDYSSTLLEIARRVMPLANFQENDALALSSTQSYTMMVSFGVFLYFTDYAYAEAVLRQMVRMAKRSVSILDIPDLAKKADALHYRRQTIGEAEYAEKYRGLDHLYFAKDWFAQMLINEPVRVQIEDQSIAGYGNSPYRFNVLIHLDHPSQE